MGGKPSKATPADRRLKANQPKIPDRAAKPAVPKFGSPGWQKKYGKGK